jgi:3-oxoacyl-[acyl-carrier-protein] synthase-3
LAELSASEVDCVLIHQANLRIIECLQEHSGIAPDKWLVNIGRIGNTASASVLLALIDLLSTRTLADGARVLLGAFGAGLTWCAALLEWGVPDHNHSPDYPSPFRVFPQEMAKDLSSPPP